MIMVGVPRRNVTGGIKGGGELGVSTPRAFPHFAQPPQIGALDYNGGVFMDSTEVCTLDVNCGVCTLDANGGVFVVGAIVWVRLGRVWCPSRSHDLFRATCD